MASFSGSFALPFFGTDFLHPSWIVPPMFFSVRIVSRDISSCGQFFLFGLLQLLVCLLSSSGLFFSLFHFWGEGDEVLLFFRSSKRDNPTSLIKHRL